MRDGSGRWLSGLLGIRIKRPSEFHVGSSDTCFVSLSEPPPPTFLFVVGPSPPEPVSLDSPPPSPREQASRCIQLVAPPPFDAKYTGESLPPTRRFDPTCRSACLVEPEPRANGIWVGTRLTTCGRQTSPPHDPPTPRVAPGALVGPHPTVPPTRASPRRSSPQRRPMADEDEEETPAVLARALRREGGGG